MIVKLNDGQREALIESINKYILNLRNKIIAKEVTANINKTLNTSYSISFIKKKMKNE